MVRCIPSRSYGFGYVSGGCYIADIVHQEIYQFFKKNLVSNLVFFYDIANDESVKDVFVHITEFFIFRFVQERFFRSVQAIQGLLERIAKLYFIDEQIIVLPSVVFHTFFPQLGRLDASPPRVVTGHRSSCQAYDQRPHGLQVSYIDFSASPKLTIWSPAPVLTEKPIMEKSVEHQDDVFGLD
jgi:hypothetical protein